MNGYLPSLLAAPTAPQYRMTLRVGEHSAHHIRNIARSCLEEWEMAELSDAVELAVTELVANVLRHVPDRRCTLFFLKQRDGIRTEVRDTSDELPSPTTTLNPESETGRGLFLLAAVVDRWGVTPVSGGGKTVWFECLTGCRAPCRAPS
ncbi:ATP-binding protein [Streptomyces sp. NPDC002328]|uniref:ATP-binding protein n=1 Tax=Streptomyces sp. NPDC002328 TaxID=3364642 RepID=UPI0036A48D6F